MARSILVIIIIGVLLAGCSAPEPSNDNTSFFVNHKVITLTNNPNARDPSYSQLIEFLKRDLTDQKEYSETDYNCVDYAKELHDNAEKAGIKAAWVGIEFIDQEVGHALNAFQTTDCGLVYIDVTSGVLDYISPTGNSEEPNTSWDKVAYLKLGSPYGVINIDEAEDLSYEAHFNFVKKCLILMLEIDFLNSEIDRYETALNDPKLSSGFLNKWRVELTQKQDRLIEKSEGAKSCGYQSLGRVEKIDINW